MKKLVVAAALAAMTVGGIALPTAAGAATHHPAKHHRKHVTSAPCKGLGLDIALGGINYCLPL
jgi:hypothetical protein